jgi:glycosyltransferase involved in cell wall biosynthesis
VSDPGTRIVAVVPAYDEEGAIEGVIREIHAFDPAIDVVVVDDGSTDRTAAVAAEAGAAVVRLPFNLGIGAAVQTGFRYALEHGYDVAVRLDGDGQHDAAELSKLLDALRLDEADVVTGSRFRGVDGEYVPPLGRRLGITWFARLVSLLSGQRVTDTTSGFQALNENAIALFARDYPTDYPEVEATVLLLKHRLRLVEVPVRMREREHGSSSITTLRSIYYAFKVTLALLVAMARRSAVPSEGLPR